MAQSKKSEKSKKKRRSWPVRIARGFGIALLLLIGALGCLAWYVQSSSGRERVRKFAEQRISQRMNGHAEIDAVEFSWFAPVLLRGVRLIDKENNTVVSVGQLYVAPDYGKLLGGQGIALREVRIDAPKIAMVRSADGTSNLKTLFIPSEAAPAADGKDRSVSIETFSLTNGEVTLQAPDTKLSVSGLTLAASLSARPKARDVRLRVDTLAFELGLEKPTVALGVNRFATSIEVDLKGGEGQAKLGKLSAELSLVAKERGIDRRFPIALDGLSVGISKEELGVDLDKLTAGALSLAALDLTAPLQDGSLSAPPQSDAIGLLLVADELNLLLGKDVLRENVAVEAHLEGDASAPILRASLSAGKARVALQGKVQNPTAQAPEFDLELTVADLDTSALLGEGVKAPPATLEKLRASFSGHGRSAETLDAKLELSAQGLAVRGIPIANIDVKGHYGAGKITIEEAKVAALDQHLTVRGSVHRETKDADLSLSLSGDVGTLLKRLRESGLTISAQVPAGLLVLPEGDLQVRAFGKLDGRIDASIKAERLQLLGGRLGLAVGARLERLPPGSSPSVKLHDFDLDLHLRGLRLSRALALRGKKLPAGFDAVFGIDISAKGTLEAPHAKIGLFADTERTPDAPLAHLALDAEVLPGLAAISLALTDKKRPTAEPLLVGSAKLPIALSGPNKGLQAGAPLDVRLQLPSRKIAELASYGPLPTLLTLPDGHLALDAHLTGSKLSPSLALSLGAHGALLGDPLSEQDVALKASLSPGQSKGTATAGRLNLIAKLHRDAPAALTLNADLSFPRSPLAGGAKDVRYDAKLQLSPQDFKDLPNSPKLAQARALGGSVQASLGLQGNAQDLAASLDLSISKLQREGKGPFDVHLVAGLSSDSLTTDLTVDHEGRLLTLGGPVGLRGKGLIPRLMLKKEDPSLDLLVDIPKREIKSLAKLVPRAKEIDGYLSGKLALSGTVKVPLLEGGILADSIPSASGKAMDVAIALLADAQRGSIRIEAGADGPRLRLSGDLSRADLPGLSDGKALPIAVETSAENVPLAELVPRYLVKKRAELVKGVVNSTLAAKLSIEQGKGVVDAGLSGDLVLDAKTFPLPESKRTLHDVKVKLAAMGDRVVLETLQASESDRVKKGRSLTGQGEVSLRGLKPQFAALSLDTKDWLVFGGSLGRIDAPRGEVDLSVQIKADLDRPIKLAHVSVSKLKLTTPDRFDKAHQPEDLHLGDVALVLTPDQDDQQKPQAAQLSDISLLPYLALGKLAVPESVKAKAKAKAAATSERTSLAQAPTGPVTGFDAEIHIAKGAYILQSPLELLPEGTVQLQIRPSGRSVRGKLTMHGGGLSLGGRTHPLTRGSLVFDDAHPAGFLDLWFAYDLPPATLRGISKASSQDSITIHMFGPPNDRRTILGGATPGALADLLAMHNVGARRFVTDADLPDSVSVEFPQYDGVLTLSFLSVNLPHLLFLDRVSGWADAYDGRKRYGQLDHYEGDRYFADGSGRLRFSKQPRGVGRSEAEAEALYLLYNDRQVLFGVGGSAGSRGGGGPGVSFEWSSD